MCLSCSDAAGWLQKARLRAVGIPAGQLGFSKLLGSYKKPWFYGLRKEGLERAAAAQNCGSSCEGLLMEWGCKLA